MVVPDNPKLYTVDEFDAFLAQAENEDRPFELIWGEIVEKMPTQLHGVIVGLIIGYIFTYFQKNPIGWVMPEARYRIPKDDHNSRLPDISVIIGRDRPLVEKGAAPYIPDLAIEVQSPDDSMKQMRQKADYYLANGAKLVWLVYTSKRIVEVVDLDDVYLLKEDETLDGGDVLPGFKLTIRDIFPKQE